MWQVAALGQFYRTIGPHFLRREDTPSSTNELEERLAAGVEETLVGMMLPLLGIGEDASSDTCWAALAELIKDGTVDFPAATAGAADEGGAAAGPPTSFANLAPADRGRLLYAIAEASLDILEKIDVADPAKMRGEQLGTDAKGRVYWGLGDLRLYREGPPPKSAAKQPPPSQQQQHQKVGAKRKAPSSPPAAPAASRPPPPPDLPWEVAASTSEEYRTLLGSLKKKGAEADLAAVVRERLVEVETEELRAEKEAKKQALLAGPRRASSRLEAAELEAAAKAEAAAERAHYMRQVDVIKGALRAMPDEVVEVDAADFLDRLRPKMPAAALAVLGADAVDDLIVAERKGRVRRRRQEVINAQRRLEREAAEAERQKRLAAEAEAREERRRVEAEAREARKRAEAEAREERKRAEAEAREAQKAAEAAERAERKREEKLAKAAAKREEKRLEKEAARAAKEAAFYAAQQQRQLPSQSASAAAQQQQQQQQQQQRHPYPHPHPQQQQWQQQQRQQQQQQHAAIPRDVPTGGGGDGGGALFASVLAPCGARCPPRRRHCSGPAAVGARTAASAPPRWRYRPDRRLAARSAAATSAGPWRAAGCPRSARPGRAGSACERARLGRRGASTTARAPTGAPTGAAECAPAWGAECAPARFAGTRCPDAAVSTAAGSLLTAGGGGGGDDGDASTAAGHRRPEPNSATADARRRHGGACTAFRSTGWCTSCGRPSPRCIRGGRPHGSGGARRRGQRGH